MAKISFYLFETSQEQQVQSACRLSRKLLKSDCKIWWYCLNINLHSQLDDMLWSFDPDSFVPHGIEQPQAPLCISAQLPEQPNFILFNFNDHALEQVNQFNHIIEIIENDEIAKQIGREKFKTYRRLGIQPRTFKL